MNPVAPRRRVTEIGLQQTLKQAVKCQGQGLHTGCQVNLTLKPAPPDSGICFIRTDLGNFEIPAHIDYVAHVSYATTLMRLGVMVATVEHLLSALVGCQIDNCIIELDSLEVPIMDGSAQCFIQMIEQAGVTCQSVARTILKVTEPMRVGDELRWMSIEPAEEFSISSTIDFAHPIIGEQYYYYQLGSSNYYEEIAPARTFGFEHEIESLRQAGLIRGGSLDNAIVLSATGLVNKEPLRFPDEFARHKILDILGDLALLGKPLLGRIVAQRSGHALHSQLVSQLLRSDSWDLVKQLEAQSAVSY